MTETWKQTNKNYHFLDVEELIASSFLLVRENSMTRDEWEKKMSMRRRRKFVLITFQNDHSAVTRAERWSGTWNDESFNGNDQS